MRISDLTILALVVSLMIIVISAWGQDVASAYSITNVRNLTYLEQSGNLTASVQNFSSALQAPNTTTDVNQQGLNYLGFLTSNLVSTAKIMFTTPSIIQNMFYNAGGTGFLQLLGIDPAVTSILLTIIIAITAFALYRTLGRSDI